MTEDGNWGGSNPLHDQHGHRPAASPQRRDTHAADPSRIESLLHGLINRLEENDERYSAALNDLEQRLTELQSRASTADPGRAPGTAEALDRVGAQAADLARRVRDADAAQAQQPHGNGFRALEDRIGEFAAQLQRGESPGAARVSSGTGQEANLADQQFGNRFTDAAQHFEQSLAAGHATADLEALNARMNELVQRFDAAMADRTGSPALRSIEAQLEALAGQFSKAQQQFSRVDAIETHLARLMEWAQQSGKQVEAAAIKASQETARQLGSDAATVNDRLSAVQQELEALNQRARQIDGRTIDTLESMNSALQSLSMQISQAPANPLPTREAAPAPPAGPSTKLQPHEVHGQSAAQGNPAAPKAPDTTSAGASAERSQVGASIPDYQVPPQVHMQPHAPENGAAADPISTQTFDDADFLASARRAAAAAAASAQPVDAPKRKGLFSSLKLGSAPKPRARESGKSSRPLLILGAGLLIVAGSSLIYGKLKGGGQEPAARNPAHLQTVPPTVTPAPKPSQFEPQRPQTSDRKDSSKLPTQPALVPSKPDAAPRRAPLVIERPATDPGQQTELPDETGAAPKLASLPQLPVEPNYPGLAVRIQPHQAQTNSPVAPQHPPVTHPSLSSSQPVRIAPSSSTPEVRPPSKPPAPMPPAAIGPQSLRLAAANGNPQAQFEIGARYAKGSGVKRDYKVAAQWYARAAAQSLAPAQYHLAALYERGRGIEKDPAMARVWYERAAKQGNIKAMHNLAVLLAGAGTGRTGDQTAATQWFMEAARHGLADSQFNLGIMYEAGIGVKKSLLEAYQWFALAAARGDKEADKRRLRLREQLRPQSLRLAEQSVRLWRAKPVKTEANEVRRPRGGWRSVATLPAKPGDRALVARAQTLLNKLGYDAGVADGVAGPQTKAAIRRFEARSGIAGDGDVTNELVKRLEALTS